MFFRSMAEDTPRMPIMYRGIALDQQTADADWTAIQQTGDSYLSSQPLSGVNRAVNRRYLMINRSQYQQAMGVSLE